MLKIRQTLRLRECQGLGVEEQRRFEGQTSSSAPALASVGRPGGLMDIVLLGKAIHLGERLGVASSMRAYSRNDRFGMVLGLHE